MDDESYLLRCDGCNTIYDRRGIEVKNG